MRKSSPIEIANIIENYILKNESYIADHIIGLDEEYINCEHAAEATGQILSDAKINHKTFVGIIYGQSHAWAQIGDIIIDPTKDQFPNIKPEDYEQDILDEFDYSF